MKATGVHLILVAEIPSDGRFTLQSCTQQHLLLIAQSFQLLNPAHPQLYQKVLATRAQHNVSAQYFDKKEITVIFNSCSNIFKNTHPFQLTFGYQVALVLISQHMEALFNLRTIQLITEIILTAKLPLILRHDL